MLSIVKLSIVMLSIAICILMPSVHNSVSVMLSAAFFIVLLNVIILSVNCLGVMAPLKLVDKVNSRILEWPLPTVLTPSVRKVFRVTESQVCNKLYLALVFLPDMTEFYFLQFFFNFSEFFCKNYFEAKKKICRSRSWSNYLRRF